jgi:hypothetical protein
MNKYLITIEGSQKAFPVYTNSVDIELSGLWGKIKGAAKKVGKAVKKTVKKVKNTVKKIPGVKTAINVVKTVKDSVVDVAKKIPVVGDVVEFYDEVSQLGYDVVTLDAKGILKNTRDVMATPYFNKVKDEVLGKLPGGSFVKDAIDKGLSVVDGALALGQAYLTKNPTSTLTLEQIKQTAEDFSKQYIKPIIDKQKDLTQTIKKTLEPEELLALNELKNSVIEWGTSKVLSDTFEKLERELIIAKSQIASIAVQYYREGILI